MGKRNDKRNDTATDKKVGKGKHRNPNSLANLKPIQPGEVRNPTGWPKGKRHAQTLLNAGWEVFAYKILDTVNKNRKAKKQKPITLQDSDIDPELEMWLKQMEKARNGDTKAFELIVAYGHGKPTQSVNVGGQPDNPIVHEHEFEEVDAEVEEWLDGWFNPVKHTKVTTKKKHANSKTDNGSKQEDSEE